MAIIYKVCAYYDTAYCFCLLGTYSASCFCYFVHTYRTANNRFFLIQSVGVRSKSIALVLRTYHRLHKLSSDNPRSSSIRSQNKILQLMPSREKSVHEKELRRSIVGRISKKDADFEHKAHSFTGFTKRELHNVTGQSKSQYQTCKIRFTLKRILSAKS